MQTLEYPVWQEDAVREWANQYGTPLFVYDEQTLRRAAQNALAFPNPYGLTVRFAMKALPNRSILRLFHDLGLHIDASSGYEVERARLAGIPGEAIQLTAQECPENLDALLKAGVGFNACSLHQLHAFGRLCPGGSLSIRVNPGLGSGHNNRTNVGGPGSSFGIWKDSLGAIQQVANQYDLHIKRLHTHIGSGADPAVWLQVARMTLEVVSQFPEVQSVNLGGGFKIGRMPDERSTDLQVCGRGVSEALEQFAKDTGRKLHLEIEPGTYLVAMAGGIVTRVQDLCDTGDSGYSFLKTDTGMTENTRISLYGALHPIVHVPQSSKDVRGADKQVLVVGHCCESGDILTPQAGNPEALEPVSLPEARIKDLLIIHGTGAYCASMAAKNYNSFPEAPEILVQSNGSAKLIRKRQSLKQILLNET